MFEGFIFDVEGTLLDSVSQNQRSLQDALEKSGYRVPIQTLRLYPGLDGDQTLQLVVPDASDRERNAILEDRREIYERHYLPSVKPLEGARDVIRILAEQGGRIALPPTARGSPSRVTCCFWTPATTSPRQPAATTSSTASRTPVLSASRCAS
jgi:beta-phosphoglucomutase-like phosphatase (HAD superfamily)